jgi:hypothetical protein
MRVAVLRDEAHRGSTNAMRKRRGDGYPANLHSEGDRIVATVRILNARTGADPLPEEIRRVTRVSPSKPEVEPVCREIIAGGPGKRGDAALLDFTQRFDEVRLASSAARAAARPRSSTAPKRTSPR